MARWGLPSPPNVLKTARDPGVTDVRNTGLAHLRRWLGPANRCPVPSFAEPKRDGIKWLAPSGPEAQIYFAGVELRGWTSVGKIKEGQTTDDL